jgi:hypothetical protein
MCTSAEDYSTAPTETVPSIQLSESFNPDKTQEGISGIRTLLWEFCIQL